MLFFQSVNLHISTLSCRRDGTLEYEYKVSNQQRFSFQAFRFVDEFQTIYLRCNVLVCHVTSDDSRCTRGCLSPVRRKRREAAKEDGAYERGSQVYSLVVGPIAKKEEDTDETQKG